MTAFDTIFPADSVEFCPHPDAQDIFVCGTYNLLKSEQLVRTGPQRRHGQCLVFKCQYDHLNFDKIQEIDFPAILDMKWCHTSASRNPTLGIAGSEGNIFLLEWNIEESILQQKESLDVANSKEILALSLDWSNRRNPGLTLGNLVVSLSDGTLTQLKPTESCLRVADVWTAHDYEPWIAAWNYWDTNGIYSGGDDFKLKGWDTRDLTQPTFVNKRFDAGITTIQNHPFIEHIIAVGSYDSTVRLFDTRKPLVPLSQTDIGGGAWRVKWHPSATRKSDLLVACMHDGFKILRFEDLASDSVVSSPGSVIQRFDINKPEDLAYGVDWSFAPTPNVDGKTAIASCSFYDHSLQFWSG